MVDSYIFFVYSFTRGIFSNLDMTYSSRCFIFVPLDAGAVVVEDREGFLKEVLGEIKVFDDVR